MSWVGEADAFGRLGALHLRFLVAQPYLSRYVGMVETA
jgi:hypothetical protein